MIIQTGVPQRMAGGCDTFEVIVSDINTIAIIQNLQFRNPIGAIFGSGMLIQSSFQLIFGKAISRGMIHHGPETFPGFHQFFFRPAKQNVGGIRGQL